MRYVGTNGINLFVPAQIFIYNCTKKFLMVCIFDNFIFYIMCYLIGAHKLLSRSYHHINSLNDINEHVIRYTPCSEAICFVLQIDFNTITLLLDE